MINLWKDWDIAFKAKADLLNAQARIQSLEAKLELAKKALMPFGNAISYYPEFNTAQTFKFSYESCKAASKALAAIQEGKDKT